MPPPDRKIIITIIIHNNKTLTYFFFILFYWLHFITFCHFSVLITYSYASSWQTTWKINKEMNVLNDSTHPTGDASDLAEEPKTCVSFWKHAQMTGSSWDSFRLNFQNLFWLTERVSMCWHVCSAECTACHAAKIFSALTTSAERVKAVA